jgi:hypothetical protein
MGSDDRGRVMLLQCPGCEATAFRMIAQAGASPITPGELAPADCSVAFRCTGCHRDYDDVSALRLYDTGMAE